MGFLGRSDGKKNPPAELGDEGSIPGLGRSPGKGNGYPLQYSDLVNPMDRGAWQVTVVKSQTRLCDFHFHTIDTVCKIEASRKLPITKEAQSSAL